MPIIVKMRGAQRWRCTRQADDSSSPGESGTFDAGASGDFDAGGAGVAQTTAKVVDLSPYLKSGQNTITLIAQNGPQTFASCATPCTFAENTAGTMFAGTLTSD